jgi:hypothetical protein
VFIVTRSGASSRSTRRPPDDGGGRMTTSRPRPGRISIRVIVLTAVLADHADGWGTRGRPLHQPVINALILLNIVCGGEFGLAIILFTVLLRVATIPFTIRQLESTRAMQAAQPEMQEIQKKYKDPKRRQEEMMRLYREHNISTLGCFMPLLIQMSVFFALYRALVYTVGGSPELISLSGRLYPIGIPEADPPQPALHLILGHKDSTDAPCSSASAPTCSSGSASPRQCPACSSR